MNDSPKSPLNSPLMIIVSIGFVLLILLHDQILNGLMGLLGIHPSPSDIGTNLWLSLGSLAFLVAIFWGYRLWLNKWKESLGPEDRDKMTAATEHGRRAGRRIGWVVATIGFAAFLLFMFSH